MVGIGRDGWTVIRYSVPSGQSSSRHARTQSRRFPTPRPYMSSPPEAAPSLADRLTSACVNGDLSSVEAAVADGASVNETGTLPGSVTTLLPLAAAVWYSRHDVVAWLLSHGADPNGDSVMYYGAHDSTAAILQLLIDAGGDVNRKSGSRPPLITAVVGVRDSENRVRVLLGEPSLDFTVNYYGKTPEQYARAKDRPAVADRIAQEVSSEGYVGSSGCD